MKFAQITETGIVRENNEDSLLVCPDIGLFAVADGMGGHRAGDVASREALKYLEKQVRLLIERKDELRNILSEAMHRTNQFIYNMAKSEPKWHGMGTTITTCFIPEALKTSKRSQDNASSVFIAHVGDSRAYLIMDNGIVQITSDHSLIEEMLRDGIITEDIARVHPARNVLTKAIGILETVNVDLYEVLVFRGNKILLCTDGLTGHVQCSEINEIVLEFRNIDDAAKKLVEIALKRGGTDNISVILIEM
ncbi:MAG: Stp1/IreP family PP2C-type Ser/Thr phosphatase [Desulfotomaculum sp.]|nr:Stp1/IreP family PP2C-type Ser/Thr phosphatase [Desulfotomaculum sp.]